MSLGRWRGFGSARDYVIIRQGRPVMGGLYDDDSPVGDDIGLTRSWRVRASQRAERGFAARWMS